MSEADKLDRVLARLPSEVPSMDLTGRVCHYVRVKRRRRMVLNLALHLVLIVSGLWLVSPLFAALPASANLSDSALSALVELVKAAFTNVESYVSYVWNGFTGLQSSIVAPVSDSVGLGVAALTLSVLLALGQLLPRSASLMDKGVKA